MDETLMLFEKYFHIIIEFIIENKLIVFKMNKTLLKFLQN